MTKTIDEVGFQQALTAVKDAIQVAANGGVSSADVTNAINAARPYIKVDGTAVLLDMTSSATASPNVQSALSDAQLEVVNKSANARATTTALGLMKASGADGGVAVAADGTASVTGWDQLTSDVNDVKTQISHQTELLVIPDFQAAFGTTSPSDVQLTEAWTTESNWAAGTVPPEITPASVIQNGVTGVHYRYYSRIASTGQPGWNNEGVLTIGKATNTQLGLTKGVSTGDGKISVNSDGEMLVNGWDNKADTAVDNLTSTSTTAALSANQGKVLDESKWSKEDLTILTSEEISTILTAAGF